MIQRLKWVIALDLENLEIYAVYFQNISDLAHLCLFCPQRQK